MAVKSAAGERRFVRIIHIYGLAELAYMSFVGWLFLLLSALKPEILRVGLLLSSRYQSCHVGILSIFSPNMVA